MSGRDDDRSYLDRDKLTYSERDRLRREGGAGRDAPRSGVSKARAEQATKEYLKQIDGLFASDSGGAEGERLARAMRDAHGTSGLAAACRAYRDAVGLPRDPSLLALFLDADDDELVTSALEGLRALQEAGGLEVTRGLKSQLRLLAQGPDDDAAEAAEEILDAI